MKILKYKNTFLKDRENGWMSDALKMYSTLYFVYFKCRSIIEDLRHLSVQCSLFGALVEYDAFGFEGINGYFSQMLHGNREVDVELVNAFHFFLKAFAAHSNHIYLSTGMHTFCEQEANNG